MPADRPDAEALLEHLDEALGRLLAARVQTGGLPDGPAPSEALAEALEKDPAHRRARAGFSHAFRVLMDLLPEEHRAAGLHVEETANHLASQAADVGWRLALTAMTILTEEDR